MKLGSVDGCCWEGVVGRLRRGGSRETKLGLEEQHWKRRLGGGGWLGDTDRFL